jgi:hypothetical protein
MFWRAIREEFHNQRFVICSGGVLAVLLYALLHLGPWRKPDLNFDFFHLIGSLTCMAFASIAGNFAFGRQSGESRIPINKFLLKLAIGAISTTASGLLMVLALALSVSIDSRDTFLESIYPDFTCFPHSTIYFYGSLITFACSVLFSLLIKRCRISVMTGFLFGTAILFLTASFWVRQPFESYLGRKPANTAILFTSILVLFFSWIVSGHSKRLKASIRPVLGFSSIAIAAICSSAVMFLSLPLSSAFMVGYSEVSRKGTEIIAFAFNDFSQQIWVIPTDPLKSNQIVKKNHAYRAVFSPDGNWFAYFSQKGIFGLRSFSVDLRVAKVDGTHDRVLFPDFALRMSEEDERGVCDIEFSPDSKYVALLCDAMISVIDRSGRIRSHATIPSNLYEYLLGWRFDGTEVLILNHSHKCVQAYNVAEQRFKTIYQLKQRPKRFRLEQTGFGIRYVLDGNALVDLDKGAAQILPDYINKASAVVSADQNTLICYYWGDYSNFGKSLSYVRRFHINTGRDELCAEFRGVIHQPNFSPDGSQIAMERQTELRQIQTVVIIENSIIRTFEGWGLIGWRDSGRVVLADNTLFPKRMALGDIDTGQIQQFYP